MLTNLLLLVVDTVVTFLTVVLLLRFYMQWMRVSFRNQLGAFVTQLTNWLVLPLRKVVPSLGGLDLSSLLPAILLQSLELFLLFILRGASLSTGGAGLILAILAVGFLEVLKLSVWLLIGVVFVSAILSWVSPYSPWAPVLIDLARPFLRPFQRVIPQVANVDLSPLVLLLVLQIVLMVIRHISGSLLPVML